MTHCFSNLSYSLISGFLKVPSSINVTVGQERRFQCQHSTADTITWRVNGTRLSDNHPLNIVTHTEMSSSGSSNNLSSMAVNIVHILTIQGAQVYNETTIQCEAVFFDSSPSELSPEVVSLVQGIMALITIWFVCLCVCGGGGGGGEGGSLVSYLVLGSHS